MVAQITVQTLEQTMVDVPLLGTTPLITHKWSAKAKRMMLDAQRGVKRAKEKRDPEADYEASIYRTAKGEYGFPAVAFKAAMVRGGKLAGVKMTDARQLLRVHGVAAEDGGDELVVIDGEPRMREDMVRVQTSSDLRYRAEFPKWRATLRVGFYPQLIDLSSVLSLIDFGGQTVGVGEWRPERNGQNGTFTIDADRDVVSVGGGL